MKGKVFGILICFIALYAVIYWVMGQAAWDYLQIKQKAPLNAWWILYTHPSPVAHDIALKALLLPIIVTILMPILFLAGYFHKKRRWVHGNARFATLTDIKKAGLLNPQGVFLGFLKNTAIFEPHDEHILLVAQTRLGKGVSIIVPTLLSSIRSIIVHDAKIELWDLTAAYRQRCGFDVFRFSPFSPNSHRFNPFVYLDKKVPLDFLQKVSYLLWPEPIKGDPIWNANSRTLFQGLALYLLETKNSDLTFGNILRLAQRPKFDEFLFNEIEVEKKLSEDCKDLLNQYASITEKTRSGVLVSFTSALEIFKNPYVDSATSANDFDLRDIRKKKMTIYICPGLANMDRSGFLNRLIFELANLLNIDEKPEDNPTLNQNVLFLLDEAYNMGVMKSLVESISFVAGYGIRILSVWQTEAQIIDRYGPQLGEAFIDNHKTKIYFTPADLQAAEKLSKKIGSTTIKMTNHTVGKQGARSKTYSLQKRALILPEDMGQKINKKKAIIFSRDCNPIIATKAIYHDDKRFLHRIVDKHNLKAAIKAKSIEELKPFIVPPPDVPSSKLDRKILFKASSISVDSIKYPPDNATDDQIDKYLNDHLQVFLKGL